MDKLDAPEEPEDNRTFFAREFDLDEYPGPADGVRTRAGKWGSDLVVQHYGGAMELHFRGACA